MSTYISNNSTINNAALTGNVLNLPQCNNTIGDGVSSNPMNKSDILESKLLEEIKKYGFENITAFELKYKATFGEIDRTKSLQTLWTEYCKKTGITSEIIDTNESETVDKNTKSKTQNFNSKEFSTTSTEEKFNILTEETAKNQFIYGQKPDNFASLNSEERQKGINEQEQKWNSLSSEEKTKYLDDTKKSLKDKIIEYVAQKTGKDINEISIENIQTFITENFNEKEINLFLENVMNSLQASNKSELSIHEFQNLNAEQKSEAIHDYIFELEQDTPELLSESQRHYIDESRELTSAILLHARNNGNEIGKIDEGSAFNFVEINKYAKENNIDRIQLQIDYLTDKKNRGLDLTDAENQKLKNLQALQTGLETVKDVPVKDYGRLSALKSSKAGVLWGESTESRITASLAYINSLKDLSPEEYAQTVQELTRELQAGDDTKELSKRVYAIALQNATAEQRALLVNSTEARDMVSNALNINELNDDEAHTVAELQKSIVADEPERANGLAKASLMIANNEHLRATSTVYSSFGTYEIEQMHVDTAYDRADDETEKVMLSNTAKNSSLEVRKNAGARTWEAYKENQVYLAQLFMQDKEVAIYMNNQNNLDKYDKDNQTDVFKSYQSRFEQNDFTQEEAVENLNHLSDQIQNCDKDNQLDMHNSIMNSSYEEVQTHAAGNIKYYDSSVQSEALDTVYATGNQKAIETAVADIPNYKSSDVQQQEYSRTVCETILQNAKEEEFQEKLLSGNLSYREIAQLTPAQRNQYYAEIYKKASPAEKIALIGKLPNGAQKKIIYTMIALYDQNLLAQMVEQGMGLDMFKACNDVKAQNKIIYAMKTSENQTVKEQYTEIVADPRNAGLFIGEDLSKIENPKTTLTQKNYASTPFNFKNKELMPTDRSGIYIA